MGILKGIGGLGKEVGRAFFGGVPKAGQKTGFAKADFSKEKPKNQSVFGLLFPSRPKPKVPEKPKDDSIFAGGKKFATEREKLIWAKEHFNEIYKTTKGRVTRENLPEYVKEMIPEKYGPVLIKRNYVPERIVKDYEKKVYQEKSISGKYDTKEDTQIVKKMFGLDKKK